MKFSAKNFFNKLLDNRHMSSGFICLLLCASLIIPINLLADSKLDSSSPNNIVIKPAVQLPNDLLITRRAPAINGTRIEGSIRVLLPESFNINSNAIVSGSIYVPGTPRINRNGNGVYRGTITGNGSPQPTNHTINLNSNTTLNHIFTQTDAIEIPTVPIPPTPQGTRDVSLSQNQSPGDFSTIRNLTINSNYGQLEVPQGTYGNFVANSNSIFVFGVEGQATTYNLTGLTLNSNSQLIIRGSVTINLLNQMSLNSNCKMGDALNPVALALNVARGGLTLNSNSEFYGVVTAPTGTFSINSNSKFTGLVICDRATLNANSLLKPIVSDTTGPELTIAEPTENQTITTATTNITGTIDDDSVVTSVKVNGSNATINNNSYSLNDFPLTPGTNILNVVATDFFGNTSTVVRTVTRSDGSNQAPVVDAGQNQTITLPTNTVSLLGQVTDDGLPNPPSQVTVLWSKKDGNGTVTFSSPNSLVTTATFSNSGTYTLTLTATDSELQASDDIVVTISPEAQNNVAPTVNAGQDQSITLPNSATLSATATDDGLPNPPGQLTYSWSKIAGVGDVTFSNQTALSTQIFFSQSGTFTLRFSASDGELVSSDELIISVSPAVANQAPIVNAGDDQVINLPDGTNLMAVVSDDGLPSSTITYSWSVVSGPSNNVVFSNPTELNTIATFTVAGTYVLQLTANDSLLEGSDTLTVVVKPQPIVSLLSTIFGFEPDSISIAPGTQKLFIRNRTGLDSLVYKVTNSSGLIAQVTVDANQDAFVEIPFTSGSFTVSVDGYDWSSQILVVP